MTLNLPQQFEEEKILSKYFKCSNMIILSEQLMFLGIYCSMGLMNVS
jgi:hypothetical protein